ncbi:MAG: hydroxyisourate hydrolase, partial [Pantoea sp.]|nr:hydroxyisourate hydrolase [Pantoea sp.]
MSTVTTHILDTAIGKPASGVAISLEQNSPEGWFPLSQGET